MTIKQDIGARPDPDVVKRHERLRISLMREVFQTERSAASHCAREAERLSQSQPASAMRACALHASQVNHELPAIARAANLPVSAAGSMLGRLLSVVRNRIADRLVEEERSYRGTLLGLRHGIDVVRMLQHVADASGQVELGGWCTRWLAEREPLVETVGKSMRWFALHPAAAIEKPGFRGAITHADDPAV